MEWSVFYTFSVYEWCDDMSWIHKFADLRHDLTWSDDLQLNFDTDDLWLHLDLSILTQKDLIPFPTKHLNYTIKLDNIYFIVHLGKFIWSSVLQHKVLVL